MTREQRQAYEPEKETPQQSCCDDHCCQELLTQAADGAMCHSLQLEHALDHVERTK